jgi:uncharacterized protein (DUF486 family)
MNPTLLCIIGLTASNVFMTFAWYGHLKSLNEKPWIIAALISWGIAFFEYMIQVPANRVGHTVMTLPQLKITQEVIALAVFMPFSIWFMKEKITMNYLMACVCMLGAVYFIFRK